MLLPSYSCLHGLRAYCTQLTQTSASIGTGRVQRIKNHGTALGLGRRCNQAKEYMHMYIYPPLPDATIKITHWSMFHTYMYKDTAYIQMYIEDFYHQIHAHTQMDTGTKGNFFES